MDRVLTARPPEMDHSDKPAKPRAKNPAKSKASENIKFTISLSPKSAEALNEIKEITDAATDSEVFRNALRLHLMLLRAHAEGKNLLVRDSKAGNAEIPVSFFAPA